MSLSFTLSSVPQASYAVLLILWSPLAQTASTLRTLSSWEAIWELEVEEPILSSTLEIRDLIRLTSHMPQAEP